jgi:dihydrofolate reductase
MVADRDRMFVAGVTEAAREGRLPGKGTAIMKLATVTQISVDGVMQANGPSEEEHKAGFERDGWAMAHFDDEATRFVEQELQRAGAFLFGRRTYDFFADYWGVMDPGSGPIADAMNTKPKYVASNTLTEGRWADTTVLSGDLAAAIGELKALPGGELLVQGSGKLIRWLLDNDLVDEMNLLVIPVVVGQGTRLFADNGPDIALDLIESRAFPKGITLQVYRPAGRPQYAAS